MCPHQNSGRASVSYGREETGRDRVRSLLIEPRTWLGAGAITLGVAGAIAAGAGVANADPGAESGSSAGSSRSATNDHASNSGRSERGKASVGAKHARTIGPSRVQKEDVEGNKPAKTAFSARRVNARAMSQDARVATATISPAAAATAQAVDTLTAAKLLDGIPETPDTLKIDLLEYPHSIPRVVVYMSGISGDGPLTQSALNAIVANISGTQYSQVGNYIDKFIEDREPRW